MSSSPKTCQIHKYHYPKPIRIVTHHIQPLEMGGADVAENKIDTCDTGHYNIHRIMAGLYNASLGFVNPYKKEGTRTERALAAKGLAAWSADGKPGKFVFEEKVAS